MLLCSIFAQNYRSLRSIRMDLSDPTLFLGENGVGKSNLYQALQPVQVAAKGRLVHERATSCDVSLPGEGGLRIVTHFAQLAEAARQRCGVRPRNAIFENGATWIEGMRLTGVIAGESDDED